ncbi:MAG TPA: hypothetical protein VFR48_08590, partial [Solirubrobacteraceae bacterium]|nr:hypothetical protein [Solirubrobacteraceae bacterium]
CVYMGAGRGRYKENTCATAEAGGPWDYIFREPRPGLTDNPQWYVDSNALLESSQSYEITATANGTQTFSATGLTKFNITCKTAKLASEARIVGSVAPAAGTSKEKIEYGECALEGKLECEINGKTGVSKEAKITTANLAGKLAYSSAASAEKEEVEESSVSTSDLLLKPAEGSTFATIKFGKGGCPLETTFNIEGEVLSKELGEPGIMATTHEVELLKEGTYWEDNSEKKAVSHTVGKLKGLFESIGLTGKLVLEVKGGEPWFITN